MTRIMNDIPYFTVSELSDVEIRGFESQVFSKIKVSKMSWETGNYTLTLYFKSGSAYDYDLSHLVIEEFFFEAHAQKSYGKAFHQVIRKAGFKGTKR